MIEERERQKLEQKLEELKRLDRQFDNLEALMLHPDSTTDYEALLEQREEAEARHFQLCKWFTDRGLQVQWNDEQGCYEAFPTGG